MRIYYGFILANIKKGPKTSLPNSFYILPKSFQVAKLVDILAVGTLYSLEKNYF